MKIYTKTGDKGKTSLYSGARVAKNSATIECLGSVDEINASLGTAISLLPEEKVFHELRAELILIQHVLFDLGAAIATPRSANNEKKLKKTYFQDGAVEFLEQRMDWMTEQLPKLTHFILPGGHPAAATIHIARSVCRRAERGIIPLYEEKEIEEPVLIYLNRLSDYLFCAARWINHLAKKSETIWEPHKTTT